MNETQASAVVPKGGVPIAQVKDCMGYEFFRHFFIISVTMIGNFLLF